MLFFLLGEGGGCRLGSGCWFGLNFHQMRCGSWAGGRLGRRRGFVNGFHGAPEKVSSIGIFRRSSAQGANRNDSLLGDDHNWRIGGGNLDGEGDVATSAREDGQDQDGRYSVHGEVEDCGRTALTFHARQRLAMRFCRCLPLEKPAPMTGCRATLPQLVAFAVDRRCVPPHNDPLPRRSLHRRRLIFRAGCVQCPGSKQRRPMPRSGRQKRRMSPR